MKYREKWWVIDIGGNNLRMIFSEAIKAANNLASIVPLLGGSAARKDY